MAAVTAVDTATGQVESESVDVTNTTGFLTGSRQVFRRKYTHYIDSTHNEGATLQRLNFFGTVPAREFRDGCSSIPYQNLGISMSPAQYLFVTAGANMMKVHSLGYTIKKITVLQENLTSRSQGTTLENTFQSRPSVLVFTDHKHQFDEVVGVLGLGTAGNSTGTNAGNPRLMRALISLPTLATAMNNDSTVGALTYVYPGSQADGAMPQVAWYMLNGVPELGSGRFYIDDIVDPVVLGEGKKHTFEWKNPNPQWHKNGSYPYNGMVATNTATPLAYKAFGYWPTSRADALNLYYRGSIFDQTGDNAYDSTQATTTAARRAGLGTKGNPDSSSHYVPPYNYIKMPPIWGPTSKMNFVVELWIEYFADIEWMTTGILPLANHFWPANASIANTSAARPTGLTDLRATFGGAQGQSLIGLEEEADEVDGEPSARRARFAVDDTQ